MDLHDVWDLIREAFREQRDLERKRKAFQNFNRNNLNYPLIQEMFDAAVKQNPGFYAKLTFPDLTQFEFGVKRPPERHEGETF